VTLGRQSTASTAETAPTELEPGASAAGEALSSPRSTIVSDRYGRRDFLLRRLLAAADVVGIMCALLAASQASARADTGAFLLWGAFTLPVWIVVFHTYGLYHRDIKRVNHTSLDDVPWLFHALLVGSLLLWGYYKLLPADQLVFAEVVTFAVVAMLSTVTFRALVRAGVRRWLGHERVLLVGDDRLIGPLVRKMRAHPEYGLEPVGVLNGTPNEAPDRAVPLVGEVENFPEIARSERAERIVLSHTGLEEETVLELIRQAKQLAVKVSVLPEMFDVLGPTVEIDDVEGVTVLGINPPVLSRSSRALKRAMDLAVALSALLVLAPLFAVVTGAIKLSSRGPVLYRQRRVGRGGRRFRLLKFRTMVPGAEDRAAELMSQSSEEQWLLLDRDPRITRVGRLLRHTSLDELPQLWNVVRGEMSLVGPRPLIEAEDRLIEGWERARLDLMPGITGLWQVLGRTNIPFEEMVKLDYLYVTNWSLWTDLRLIFRTLPAVVTRRGAN
jgi:exopolysaccharide biosynthesis polyprenyl glycosylphosphotransferase